MTAPDGAFPEGAANYASLAAWAAMAQADWEAFMRNPIDFTFTRIITALFEGLQTGVSFALSLISGIVKAVLNLDPTTFFATVEDALDSLGPLGTAVSAAASQIAAFLSAAGDLTMGAAGALLASLATMVNQIGGILAGEVITPINTAVQQVQDWWAAITDAASETTAAGIGALIAAGGAAAGQVEDIITGAGETVAANVGLAIAGANEAAADIGTAMQQAAAGAAATLGSIGTQVYNSIVGAFSAAPQFLQGLAGAYGQTATEDAFKAAAQARIDQAAEQARITSSLNAVFNVSPATAGVNQAVDFSTYANQSGMSGIMSPGSGSGAGYMGITSGEAKFQGGTGTDIEVFPTPLVSAYQVVEVTLGSLQDLLSGSAGLSILLRSNSARTTALMLTVYSLAGVVNVALGCRVSDFDTVFVTTTLPGISSGGKLKIIAGDPSSVSPYAMQVLYNNTPIITYTDSSHVQANPDSSTYRYIGLAMYSTVSGKISPTVRSVTYQDNPPPPTDYPFNGRPAIVAEAKGQQYASSDCGRIDRNNGTAWENIYLGPKAFAKEPPSSGWSWVNQGGASVANDADAILLTAPNSSGANWRLRARSLSPTSNYIATAYLEHAAVSVASASVSCYAGIGLRNSSSGSYIIFGPGLYVASAYAAMIQVYRYTNPTTFNAASLERNAYNLSEGKVPNWYRIRDDGSNRYFEYSFNGVDWLLAHSESRTAFITPDQFIIGANNNATGADTKLRLRSLSGIS